MEDLKQYPPAENNGWASPIYTGEDFEKEFSQPAKPAVDAPDQDPPPTEQGGETVTFIDPPEERPIFEPPFIKPNQEPPGPEPAKVISKSASRFKLDLFLRTRDFLQSRMLAKIAKTKDPTRYRYDQEELDMLAEAYMPYMEKFGGHIPPWLEIAMVEIMFTGAKFVTAINERKINNSNAAIAVTPQAAAVVSNAGAAPERKRFKIDSNGFYTYDSYGNYVYAVDRKEKADLKNIKELVDSNGPAKIKKCFGLSDDQIPQSEEDE